MKMFRLGLCAVALAAAAATAVAQNAPSPADAAKAAAHSRHALFETLGTAMGPVGGMLRGRVAYDAKAAGLAGARLEVLGGMIGEVTKLDTSKVVTTTEAKPNIWTERADFDAKAAAMVKAAGNLKTVAASGDEAAVKKAMGEVGASCKSCHDKFRKEDK